MTGISLERLSLTRPLELNPGPYAMQLVYGIGRSAPATVRSGTSLWIPLRGQLRLGVDGSTLQLRAGELLLWNEGRIHTLRGSSGCWIALVGDAESWRTILSDALPSLTAIGSVLYPGRVDCPNQVRDTLISLARNPRPSSCPTSAEDSMRSLVLSLWELQRPIDALAHRCTGHTQLHKRRNLMRLLRVRERIMRNPTKRLDLASLAELANYSSGHFLRAFRDVFEETPVEYASRVRLEHARLLIQTQSLSVTEVAGLAGYNSVSTFCRSFRRTFGASASEIREQMLQSA